MTSALRSTVGNAVVDDFLRALGTGLRGPRRFRIDLLLEVCRCGDLVDGSAQPDESVTAATRG